MLATYTHTQRGEVRLDNIVMSPIVPRIIIIRGQVPQVTTNFILTNTSDEAYAKAQEVVSRQKGGTVMSLVLSGLEFLGEVQKSNKTYERRTMHRVKLSISPTSNKVCNQTSIQCMSVS